MDINVINGTKWVRLNDICDIIRHVAACELESAADAICSIAYMMFYDKAHNAKTDEERFAAMELPGDFVVCRPEEGITKIAYVDDLGGIIRDYRKARHFEYMSEAMKVADEVGENFKAICVGIEDTRIVQRALAEFIQEDFLKGFSRRD